MSADLLTDHETDIVGDLHEDGDRYVISDRWSIVLRIEVDDDCSINDYDCYGTTERYCHDYHDRAPRPSGFTGAARKIQMDRGSWIWWQPAPDFVSAKAWGGSADDYADAFRLHVETATDLLRYGFKQIGLELHEVIEDTLGNDHDVIAAQQWLGGVDSLDGDNLSRIVGELLSDLGYGTALDV